MHFIWIFFFVIPVLTVSRNKHPVLDLPEEAGYHGVIKEDQRIVDVTPEVRIIEESGPVCSYDLKWADGDSQDIIPFVVDVEDKQSGRIRLKLRSGEDLNCELQKTYRFSLVAKRCGDGELSDSASLSVDVDDVNDHNPEFVQQFYETTVDEGRLYDSIIKVEAVDRDCSPKYSEICRYEIVSSDDNSRLFSLDSSGFLKNTEPLSWSSAPEHVLKVVAHDCGMRSSSEVTVTIHVRRSCSVGWQGFHDRIEYFPQSGTKSISDDAKLELCDLHCDIESINATIALSTEHIALGCDRDNYDLKELVKSCGVDSRTIELLPRVHSVNLENDSVELSSSSSSEENSSEDVEEVYLFDGKNNALIVAPETMKPVIPTLFTLSFWMKHDRTGKSDSHIKEHILCNSDDHKMNRHHFALFVRNCKLELLIRQEFQSEDDNTFSPAEWRWKLGEVCDNEWHQYTLSVNFPTVELYVDGRHFPDAEKNPEIYDDFPMHKTVGIKTKMVIGACWHGRSNRMAEFLRGYLTGVTFLAGKQEKQDVIGCTHRCKEFLEFKGLDVLRPGMEAILNADMSKLTFKALDTVSIGTLMRKVAYVNIRQMPKPGHRGITVETNLKCKHMVSAIKLPDVKNFVFVMTAPDPHLSLAGTNTISKPVDILQNGVKIFDDLTISIVQENYGEKYETSVNKLDSCKITMLPSLNKEHEYFSSPATLIGNLGLNFQNEDNGLSLRGIQSVKAYSEVLRQIHYFNLRAEHYSTRSFSLTCKMLNGKVESNKFAVVLTIVPNPNVDSIPTSKTHRNSQKITVEKKIPRPVVADIEPSLVHQQEKPHHDRPVHKMLSGSESHHLSHKLRMEAPLSLIHDGGYETLGTGSVGSGTGGVVAIVVVVVVGIVLLLVIVGILKIRTANPVSSRRSKRNNKENHPDGGELAWDDSGLNITINPLNEGNVEAGKNETHDDFDEDSDVDSDDGESYKDGDYMTEDDEENEVLPHVQTKQGTTTGLEWDDSTLNSNGLPAKSRSQLYTV